MNAFRSGWPLLADDTEPTGSLVGWVMLAIGLFAILSSLNALRTGIAWGTYRKIWGLPRDLTVEREFAPIQFAIRVSLQLLLGLVFAFFGVRWLLLS